MNAKALERLDLENKLRRGIDEGQLCLYYQPKLDIQKGRVFGCEALIRWMHPELGLVSPIQFIPIAEESGLIRLIGKLVTREACRQAKIWSESFPDLLPVSINLSPKEFSDNTLLEEIQNVLTETGLAPCHLEIELTESTVMDYQDQENMSTLSQIQALGVRLSIDDFGTGYSSLSYLKNMPFNAIKIDRSFVEDITRDSNDEAIILAIISIAQNLNLEIIAEGVETKEQLEFLRTHGSEKIQGYLFSKPLPPEELEAHMISNEAREILDLFASLGPVS
jgi:EAL domain-containing protein (putative c-di-GMP-specific phosphodiesterase class I)